MKVVELSINTKKNIIQNWQSKERKILSEICIKNKVMHLEVTEQLKNIRTGHILLVLCCIIYLAWWSITFNPMKKFPSLPKYFLFMGIAASGIVGLKFLISATWELPVVKKSIPCTAIIIGGLVTYAVLLYLTGHFLHRQVSTELFLIVGWTILELCVVSGIFSSGSVSVSYVAIMSGVIIVAAIVGMICYLLYYNLKPVIGFYDGMIPLILFGIVMTVQAVLNKVK